MHEIRTLSPTLKFCSPAPTEVTVPTPSWPRMRPDGIVGMSPLRIWRSVPQMVEYLSLTIASVGFWISGFRTSDSCGGLLAPW